MDPPIAIADEVLTSKGPADEATDERRLDALSIS